MTTSSMSYSRNDVVLLPMPKFERRPPTLLLGWLALTCVALWGCRSVPPPQAAKAASAIPQAASSTNRAATVVAHYPAHPYHFRVTQKLNPLWWFRNADDPQPPDWY